MPRDVRTRSPKRLRVAHVDGRWEIHDGARVVSSHSSQDEALTAAQSALRLSGGELAVQLRDGRVRESVTLGRRSMAKMAAVEGIRLSEALERQLADLDRRGATGDQRRREIAAQFRKTKA